MKAKPAPKQTHSETTSRLTPPHLKIWAIIYSLTMAAALVALFIIGAHATYKFEPSVISQALITVIGAYTLTSLGAIIINHLFLRNLRASNGRILVTHRMALSTAREKIKLGKLIPHTSARDLKKEWFINILDGKTPCTWVSIGEPGDVPDLLLGSRHPERWTVAISFAVSPDRLLTPPFFLKHYFGLSQQRLLGSFDLSNNYKLFIREGNLWKCTTSESLFETPKKSRNLSPHHLANSD